MNNQAPLVSVIICFLNEQRFLAEAVESVLAQTYTNWEMVLVDDGSSDNSMDMAKGYAGKLPEKVIYGEHEAHANRGLSASRNHGISLSSGELVAFLDADDVWSPGKLQIQVDLMRLYPHVGMLCEASEYWYSWSDKTRDDVIIQVGKEQDRVFDPPGLSETLYPLSDGSAPCPSGLMVRRPVLERHGGFEAHFTGKYQLYEDQGFLNKIYLSESVYVSSLCNNRYRQREGSLVEKVTTEGNYYIVRKYFLEWLQKYMVQHAIVYPSVQQLLKKGFEPVVTVLMPVYNAEKYIKEAIDSILQQTFSNFVFLIIDDGSTDSGPQIIQSYNDARIRFVQNGKNLGISATLNKGIDMCDTELIARMDADDISYPGRLQKQCDYLRAHPECALLSTAAQMVTPDKEPVLTDKFRAAFYFYNLNFECWIYHPTVMYRRSAVIDVGKYSAPYSEDYELWWQISRKYKIHHLEEILLDYRLTDESLCRVTKKTEYEKAQFSQVVRNIQYHTGSGFSLTYSEVECLRHNFEPILKENSVNAIANCLKKLDHINQCILQKENVNFDMTAIYEAAYYKKGYIISFFLRNLAQPKAAWLLMHTGYLQNRCIRLGKRVYRKLRNMYNDKKNSVVRTPVKL